jgi:hypothetical protein
MKSTKGITMTYYNKFDTQVQCEEHNEVSPEEQAEVFQMMADEHDASQDFEGYAEWSESLEEKDYLAGYSNSTDGPSYNGLDV